MTTMQQHWRRTRRLVGIHLWPLPDFFFLNVVVVVVVMDDEELSFRALCCSCCCCCYGRIPWLIKTMNDERNEMPTLDVWFAVILISHTVWQQNWAKNDDGRMTNRLIPLLSTFVLRGSVKRGQIPHSQMPDPKRYAFKMVWLVQQLTFWTKQL